MQITLRMLQDIIGMMIIVGVVIVVNQASRKINAKNFFNLPFLDQYSQKLRVIFSLHNVSNLGNSIARREGFTHLSESLPSSFICSGRTSFPPIFTSDTICLCYSQFLSKGCSFVCA